MFRCRSEDEEKLTFQITDMRERIYNEKARASKLEQKVQLHVSLKAEDKVKIYIFSIVSPFSNLKHDDSQVFYVY